MGLGIRAVRQAHWHAPERCGLTETGQHLTVYNDPEWRERASDLRPGCYEFADQFHFHVGSYHAYNAWRRWLAVWDYGLLPDVLWKEPEKFAGLPFAELINFSDCDGTLGTAVAKKLAHEFRGGEEIAMVWDGRFTAHVLEYPGHASGKDLEDFDVEYWRVIYGNFRKAFEMAADGGFVRFC